MAREYVAYEGPEFQIEWYYSSNGRSQAREYYLNLSPSDRTKVIKLFRMIGNAGRILNQSQFRNEGDKIYAFKPQPHRFLSFFVEGRKIIVTNAFWKKTDKLPPEEKDRALKCKGSFQERIDNGTYYEEE